MKDPEISKLWIKSGISDLSNENYFNAFQSFQGALKRSIIENDVQSILYLFEKSIPSFISKNKTKLNLSLGSFSFLILINAFNPLNAFLKVNLSLVNAKMISVSSDL